MLAAKKRILRSLPELGSDASFDFLHAVAISGDDGKNLVNDIYPNFHQVYREFYAICKCCNIMMQYSLVSSSRFVSSFFFLQGEV